MIAKEIIEKLVREKLDERMFIVEINVSSTNVIHIFVDSYDGMTIEQCIAISRNVEHNLDREEEDFALEVSSPGLTESFKVKEQYIKYTGKAIKVVTEDQKLEGLLKSTSDEGIVLETSGKEKVEGQKKKQLVVKEYNLKYDDIKSAKAVISFK
ncbi:ribosome assembly cofactor RimP [Maribellus sp. CM-23]|uniref:ribosome assembly cofactor RimP n=1 Tax=Maribellus sp. CM-23 TaxID=2781026 RepID=UPI001F43DE25|nr:ribosome assembly cofactor RimP [Maribellus sp. CM-23]MCE4566211.1 ribosome assembly cofactor RimP [Maribellus sp. CM-23]